MKYFTQLLGRSAATTTGQRLGKVQDAVVSVEGLLPTIEYLLVQTTSGVRAIAPPVDAMERDDPLVAAPDTVTDYRSHANDFLLRRDVLDKQIVDVQGHRVVRVNDIRLARSGERICVVGVDAGLRATLRRLGIAGPVEAVMKLIRRPLHSNLIAWNDVETLERGGARGRIKLKVPLEKIARLHPADIAEIVAQLNPQQRVEVIESLDIEKAADTMEEAEPEVQLSIIESLGDEKATDILEEMEPDEAADLLGDLPDVRSEELLEQMEPNEAADVKELLSYNEETAGGLMTTEYIAIIETLTAEETINHLRETAPKAETIYYIYVVDEEERLVGVLSLRDLVVAHPETSISDIMVRNVIHVDTDTHADEVAKIITKYNLLAAPVVNEENRLQGIITVDDTLERLLPPERRRRLPTVALQEEEE